MVASRNLGGAPGEMVQYGEMYTSCNFFNFFLWGMFLVQEKITEPFQHTHLHT